MEHRRPEWVRTSPAAPWLTVAAVCIGAFMGQLDASIVSLALPSLRHAFGASLATVTWVGQSYLLVLVAGLPAAGRLADTVGRKLVYGHGFVVFAFGSAACALAPNLGALIAFRAVQGIGAAMLQGNSVAIVSAAAPPGKRGRALGIQGGAQALGLALGPAAGGLLIGVGGWRLIFWVNVVVGVIGAVLGWTFIPRSRELAPRTGFDWAGLAAIVPAAAAVMLTLSFAGQDGAASPAVWVTAAVAAGAVAVAVGIERRAADPLIDRRLLADPRVRRGIGAGMGANALLFGTLTLLPFYLQEAHGLSAAATGGLLMVLPLGIGLVAPVAGRAAERGAPRRISAAGMVAAAGALAALAVSVAAGRPPLGLVVGLLAVVGLGLGAFTPANNTAVMAAAPTTAASGAGGLINVARGLGTAFGLGLVGLLYSSSATAHGAGAGLARTATVLAVIGAAAAAASWAGGHATGRRQRGRYDR